MKPKLLDPWTLGRVQAPEKASAKFFFCKYLENSDLDQVASYHYGILLCFSTFFKHFYESIHVFFDFMIV